MGSVTRNKIAAIIEQRKRVLPDLLREEQRLADLRTAILSCTDEIDTYTAHEDADQEVTTSCGELRKELSSMLDALAEYGHLLQVSLARFNKDTINIGFGGKKGVGKSYLLQKLSGLSDDVVPSNGNGLPVTATSSRIFNSDTARAEVLFYSEQEFLDQVIRPYCVSISLTPPASIAEFRAMSFPEDQISEAYVVRLEEIREHLDAFRGNLGHPPLECPVESVRKYVSYSDRMGLPTYDYLAVRTVNIHTPFPETDVAALGLIDLPGLGELNPTVQLRHANGMKDVVDLALLIRSPQGTRVDWDNEDENAYRTLCEATTIDRKENFLLVVQNEYRSTPDLADKARASTLARHPRIRILQTRSTDTIGLSVDILHRALDHLAKFLPEMDQETIGLVKSMGEKFWDKVRRYLDWCIRDLAAYDDMPYPSQVISEKADTCRMIFDSYCKEQLDELMLSDDRENCSISEQIERIKDTLLNYLDTGCGEGSIEKWIEKNRILAIHDSPTDIIPVLADKVRVTIADCFCENLDITYSNMVLDLQERVVNGLRLILQDGFFTEATPTGNLERLRKRINDDSGRSYEHFLNGIDTLLQVKIEHRTQFYPRVYQFIREFKEATGPRQNIYTIPSEGPQTRRDIAEFSYYHVKGLAERVIDQVADALKQETLLINRIMIVVFEHLADEFCKNQKARNEWDSFVNYFWNDLRSEAETRPRLTAIITALKKIQTICA